MNTALKSPAPAANIKLYRHAGYWYFDCWGPLAYSQPQFTPDDTGLSRMNPTGYADTEDMAMVATVIQVHNPLAVFAGDARAEKETP